MKRLIVSTMHIINCYNNTVMCNVLNLWISLIIIWVCLFKQHLFSRTFPYKQRHVTPLNCVSLPKTAVTARIISVCRLAEHSHDTIITLKSCSECKIFFLFRDFLELPSYKNEVTSYHYQQSKKSHAQGDPPTLPSADLQLMMEEDDE